MKIFYLSFFFLTSLFTNSQTRKYVTQNGSGAKDGSSWANAWDAKIFADTLNTQPAGREIWMAKGVYRPTKNNSGVVVASNSSNYFISSSRTFLIPSSVKIIGGFAGTENNLSERIKSQLYGQNKTILDGADPLWNYPDFSNSLYTITLKNCDDKTIVDGFYFRNYSNWSALITATSSSSSSPSIFNCYFGYSGDSFGGSYGGILINTPGATISVPIVGNCFFNTVNRNSYWPIGATDNCKPSINNCLFVTDQYNSMCILFSGIGTSGTSYPPSHGGNITNCTFYNSGASFNPRPTINGFATDSIFITNSILWNDAATNQGYTFHLAGNLFSVRNTFLQTQTYPGASLPAYQQGTTTVNPQFTSNDADGADNIFGTADDGLQLAQGSPGINYGLNEYLPDFSVKDILGKNRVSGCKVDAGPYEYQFASNNIITLSESSTENCTQYPVSDSTIFIDPATCNVTAKVIPAGANPVSGIVKVCTAKNSAVSFVNGLPYVQRHYNIEPLTNASTATARVTIYFTQLDFDNYNAAANGFLKLPTSPTDATGKSNVRIEQDHGTSVTSVPGSYSGTTISIDPDDNDIVWNSTSFIWEVSFNVTGFSGFFITTFPGGPVTNYFRSRQSGNWDDRYTWESSTVADFSSSVTSPATYTPDYNDNAITILNTHVVSLRQFTTLDQLVINSGGTLLVNANVTVTINDGPGNDLVINNGGSMVIGSRAAGTASIGRSTGNIVGNITVERYLSNRRAWRLLGIPFSTSPQSIKSSWMENGSASSGYGTHITTFNGDANAINFDGIKPASSIRTYSSDNFNSDEAHTPNTTNNITSNPSYFLFARGDRAIDRTISGAATSSTILRISGSVNSGNITGAGITGTSFSLIPNPYPSAIDFDAIKSISANSSINTFYVWDATLGTIGQYRAIQITGSAPPYTYTATPGAQDNKFRLIESGTAFFIPGNRTINFTEAVKSSTIIPFTALRTLENKNELVINLNILNTDNTISLSDGV
ncbi:MAG: hypothetical protein M3004_13155, partial [Bacteroidota bacterium]|nr:hypothetical protein [Bacteroidota bacterium]